MPPKKTETEAPAEEKKRGKETKENFGKS